MHNKIFFIIPAILIHPFAIRMKIVYFGKFNNHMKNMKIFFSILTDISIIQIRV